MWSSIHKGPASLMRFTRPHALSCASVEVIMKISVKIKKTESESILNIKLKNSKINILDIIVLVFVL